MKRIVFTGVLLMLSINFAIAQNGVDILPQNSQDFISEHFSSETVTSAEKEDGWFSLDKNEMYEVHLSNGVKLDFNKAGEITEIDSRDNMELPEDAFPENILDYVQENHQGTRIVSWERDNDEQEVELEDGTDLEFDESGKFLKLD